MFIMHALHDCDEMLRDELTWSRSGRRLLGWNWSTRDRQLHIRKLPGCRITTKIKSFINIRILLHGIITSCQGHRVRTLAMDDCCNITLVNSRHQFGILKKTLKNELTRRNSRTPVWLPNVSIRLHYTSIWWQHATIQAQRLYVIINLSGGEIQPSGHTLHPSGCNMQPSGGTYGEYLQAGI